MTNIPSTKTSKARKPQSTQLTEIDHDKPVTRFAVFVEPDGSTSMTALNGDSRRDRMTAARFFSNAAEVIHFAVPFSDACVGASTKTHDGESFNPYATTLRRLTDGTGDAVYGSVLYFGLLYEDREMGMTIEAATVIITAVSKMRVGLLRLEGVSPRVAS